MSARAEWEPLTWEEAEGNRLLPRLQVRHRGDATKGSKAAGAAPDSWIRYELEHRRQSVEEVRAELAACRAYLRTWTAGEPPGARANLMGLSDVPGEGARVEEFLGAWLGQLEQRLEVMSQGVTALAQQTHMQNGASAQARSRRRARRIAHRSRTAQPSGAV
jgi:hypothetical protein